jgi:hypothetical protein
MRLAHLANHPIDIACDAMLGFVCKFVL